MLCDALRFSVRGSLSQFDDCHAGFAGHSRLGLGRDFEFWSEGQDFQDFFSSPELLEEFNYWRSLNERERSCKNEFIICIVKIFYCAQDDREIACFSLSMGDTLSGQLKKECEEVSQCEMPIRVNSRSPALHRQVDDEPRRSHR
jgi:hypothetical protein